MDDRRYVHHEDPFRTPDGAREPGRRFRGRLASPVTIWTAGSANERAGLTVGSLLLAEGDPARIIGLINDLTDLYDRILETERFIVHVAHRRHRALAERFAGLRPSPGGPFVDLPVALTEWGPTLDDLTNRAYCRLVDVQPNGYQRLVRGDVERFDLDPIDDPLIHFRGRYRDLPS